MIQNLKNIASVIIKKHNIKPIRIEFKQVRRGRARYKTRSITIPTWIFKGIKEYRIYYMVHELTHFIGHEKFGIGGHGKLFKKIENQILADYNIIPIYSKAYPKELQNPQGQTLCGKFGEK